MNVPLHRVMLMLSIGLVLMNCKKRQDENTEELLRSQVEASTNWDGRKLFDDPSNPFLQPIPSSYQVHPNSAQMLELSGNSPTTLRENVTSPNGTTAAALTKFQEGNLGKLISTAMQAARDRSIELA